MFEKNKKYKIKDYQKERKGKISFSGHSPSADWFIVILVSAILTVLVFYFSIREINYTINFSPEPDQTIQNTINDKKVLEDLDVIIAKYKKEESEDVEKMIDEESVE